MPTADLLSAEGAAPGWNVVKSLHLDAKAGESVVADDIPLCPPVQRYLRAIYPGGIYRHQAKAIASVLNGYDVCLATSTASGKTLAFTAAGLDRLATNAHSRVLAVYPQRALGSEQEQRWAAALKDAGIDASVCRIDGSVASSNRPQLLRRSRVVIATPDVLHAWMLSHAGDAAVRSFLANLNLVVIDEVHTYTGVFGSNAGFLFRRLQHLASILGGRPQFFCASATIREPERHLSNLFGREFAIVGPDEDTSPRHGVRIDLVTPPLQSDFLSEVTGYLSFLTQSTSDRFLAFVDSRKQTEQIATIVGRQNAAHAEDGDDEGVDGEDLQEVAHSVAEGSLDTAAVLPYRAGFEERDRQIIQRRLTDGSLRGVISTSALELGIDIPHLDLVVLVGVPRSSTSLQQRIGRVGRRKPGRVVIIHSGDLYDETIFRSPERLLDRPPAEGALYLQNRRIQYIHALCLARAGGEHDLVGGGEEGDGAFVSPIPWPEGFIELCTQERLGQVPTELQPMKAEAGDVPNYAFPLRDVESQFQVEAVQGPHRRSLGSISFGQVLREAYPGAIYYYATQPYRIISVSPFSRQIIARRDRYYHTQAAALPTCVFPNLSDGNVHEALVFGSVLRLTECNLQIRESLVGLKERQGGREASYQYPLTGAPSGVRFDPNRFTRNYFTTGVLVHHPVFDSAGADLESVAALLFEALLMAAPYERQDLGVACDKIRADGMLLPVGSRFIAVHDQTYGSLRLSGRLMREGLLQQVTAIALELALTAEPHTISPPVVPILEVLASVSQEPCRPAVVGIAAEIPPELAELPRVVAPGSKGLNVRRGNAEFEVERVIFNPRLGGLAYVGRHLTGRQVAGQIETIRGQDMVEIPGESTMGFYDYDTGDVRI